MLQEQIEFWSQEGRNRGLSSIPSLRKSLDDAMLALPTEQERLENTAGNCRAGCCPRMKLTVFPAILGLRIQTVTDTFNDIPNLLAARKSATEALDAEVQRMPAKETITDDSRYVPFETSESAVREAVENREGPTVILLHGGAGKGKTTLAHKMVVHFNKEVNHRRKSPQRDPGKRNQTDELTEGGNNMEENTQTFDLVFFFSWGPEPKVEVTLVKLLQRLGCEPQLIPELSKLVQISHLVRQHLAERKVLLILDDANDGQFLETIVGLCGNSVKLLVTSHLGDLCERQVESKYAKIQIQDIGQDEA